MTRRRVLLFGAFDLEPGYPRARSLRQGLEAIGVEVAMLRETLFPGRGERARTAGSPWRWPAAASRVLRGRRRLQQRLREVVRAQHFDAVIVPYPAWFTVGLVRRVYDGPVVADLFLSLADTVVGDRRLFRKGGAVERLLRAVDRRACQAADLVCLDTPQHAKFVESLTGLPEQRIGWVPIGDPDAPAQAPDAPPTLLPGESLRVLYVGTGVPLHGVPTMLAACARARQAQLTFVGGTDELRRSALALGRGRVSRVLPWLDMQRLSELIASSHVVLGVFGAGDKAQRVVPFKVVHALAHGRVALTAETPALRTLLTPGVDCLTVPTDDPVSLARVLDSIVARPDLLAEVGGSARNRYEQSFSPLAIGTRLGALLESVTGDRWLGVPESKSAVAAS
jgi:glycosyltransferase involved in cell wall biosynthesis